MTNKQIQNKNKKAAETKINATKSIREGESRLMASGLMAKIIAYRKWNDIDILFEDGYIATGKSYSCFKKGTITHPDYSRKFGGRTKITKAANERIGQTKPSKCGLKMTVKEYCSASDMTVLFENGESRKHVTWTHFKAGNVLPPSQTDKKISRTGEKGFARDGSEMTIIAYRSSTDIDVQFADGSIQKGLSYDRFIKGKISVPKNNPKNKWKEFIGTTVRATCGLDMTVVDGKNSKDVTIRFEDGSVVKHKTVRFFLKGIIKHPILGAPSKEKAVFYGYTNIKKAFSLNNGKVFYYATTPDQLRVVATPQQMMANSLLKS